MICNLDNIKNIIEIEGLELMVVSHGGCASNTLIDSLEKNNYKIRSQTYNDILCHCPYYIETHIPIIYIYDNPMKSFISMVERGSGIWDINQQKMSNNKYVDLSNENLLGIDSPGYFRQIVWIDWMKDDELLIKYLFCEFKYLPNKYTFECHGGLLVQHFECKMYP